MVLCKNKFHDIQHVWTILKMGLINKGVTSLIYNLQ